jgi:membrane-associated protein
MIETVKDLFVKYVLHLNTSLDQIIQTYGTWTYLILFTVIFCETGLVVTPFLPGDSLLFAAGFLSARENCHLNVSALFAMLAGAAILGDNVNYWIGRYVGPRAFSGKVRFLKKEYLDRTHRFFEKYGPKAIVLARFVPIVRTFTPFVAGIGAMNYAKFLCFDIPGGLAWVGIFLLGGHWFGHYDFVQKNFELIVPAIIIISVLPMVVEVIRAHLAKPEVASKSRPDTP